MPQNKKGSILIYTLFLTSFLVLFFISFQWEIEQKLEWAKGLEQSTRDISSRDDILVSLKTLPKSSTNTNTDESISLVSLSQSGNIWHENIDSNHSKEYWITQKDSTLTLSLDITEWGPVRYYLANFSSGSESSALLVSSWVVTSHASITPVGTWDQSILVIEGLGGHTRYILDTDTATTLASVSSYEQIRTINGYSKKEWIYEVVHFTPKSRAGFPYESLWMYLKQ